MYSAALAWIPRRTYADQRSKLSADPSTVATSRRRAVRAQPRRAPLRCGTRKRAARRIRSSRERCRSATSGFASASSRRASRTPSTTRRAYRRDSSALRWARHLIVEEEERQLRQWDYLHRPAETRHVIVGAGDGRARFSCRRSTRGRDAPLPGQRRCREIRSVRREGHARSGRGVRRLAGDYEPLRLPGRPISETDR